MKKSTIKIREGSWVAKLAAKKLATAKVAIVIGHTIHLHNTTREEFETDERWVKHELCHIRQYEKYGFFNFMVRYLWESLRKGYYNNRYEVEARAAEKNLR